MAGRIQMRRNGPSFPDSEEGRARALATSPVVALYAARDAWAGQLNAAGHRISWMLTPVSDGPVTGNVFVAVCLNCGGGGVVDTFTRPPWLGGYAGRPRLNSGALPARAVLCPRGGV